MRILRSLFGCAHNRTTFPQGKDGACHVACLDCGREFAYSWAEMRIGGEIPRLAVDMGRLEGSEAHA